MEGSSFFRRKGIRKGLHLGADFRLHLFHFNKTLGQGPFPLFEIAFQVFYAIIDALVLGTYAFSMRLIGSLVTG